MTNALGIALLVAGWITSPADTTEARHEITLPLHGTYDVGAAALLRSTSNPKPKNPRNVSSQFGVSYAAYRAHWREWISVGYEAFASTTPEPTVYFTALDSLFTPRVVGVLSGTTVRYAGVQARFGFDRLLGPEEHPVAYAGIGGAVGLGQATSIQLGTVYLAPYSSAGVIVRAGLPIRFSEGFSMAPQVTWSSSYLTTTAPGIKGTYQTLYVSLAFWEQLKIPRREGSAAATPTPER